VREFAPAGIILSGGPNSVYEEETPARARRGVHPRRAGAGHLLRHADDGGATGWPGRVCAKREFGYAEIRARGHTALLRDIQDRVNDEAMACSTCG